VTAPGRVVRGALALTMLAVLAGCAVTPARRVYVLGDLGSLPPATRSDIGRPVLEIRSVLVPDYLDTRDILVRQGPNEVVASRTGAWGERLSLGIARALGAALTARLPGVVVTTSSPSLPARWQLLVDVNALELRPDGTCLLNASWTVLNRANGRVLASQTDSFTATTHNVGDEAMAGTVTAAIGQLAGRIAATVPH
jgi:uncharacterized protein